MFIFYFLIFNLIGRTNENKIGLIDTQVHVLILEVVFFLQNVKQM